MTHKEKMQALWQIHLLLQHLSEADNKLVSQLGLTGKSLYIYDYIKEQEYTQALDEFKHLSVEHKERFLSEATNIYHEEK